MDSATVRLGLVDADHSKIKDHVPDPGQESIEALPAYESKNMHVHVHLVRMGVRLQQW